MKNLIIALIRLSLALMLIAIIIHPAQAAQPINVPDTSGIFNFIQANWAKIALILSETAALMPTKVNGIIQGVIQFIPFLFKKKNK